MAGSKESFADLFAQTSGAPSRRVPRVGERVRGIVTQVGKTAVFLELDGKGQAFMEAAELRGPDGAISARVGDALEGVIVSADERGGEVRIARTFERGAAHGGAEKSAALALIADAHAAGVGIEGKVTGHNKGGLEVDIEGIRCFCPLSQMGERNADPATFVGKTLAFLVTEIKDGPGRGDGPPGKNVVVSRRALLEREAARSREAALARIAEGQQLSGTVTSVREFGAFVDLGGVEGLVPISEITHDRSAAIGDVVHPGDSVEVLVREIRQTTTDRGPQTRITLSLKALSSDPWERAPVLAAEGTVHRGAVVRTMDFGAFVRLAPGLEGLLHVSELGGGATDARTALLAGTEVLVVVKKLDVAARKIGLVPAPEGATPGTHAPSAPSISVGSVVRGHVDRVEPYGVFVQIEGTRGRAGRGLVPNAELGTARGSDTRKQFPLGTAVTAKVLETGDGRIRLSFRALVEDEERADYDGYRESAAAPKTLGTFADLLKKR